ncbi:2-oxo-4-hydroxy-4-carboxy-5-ureidoimidazoline decarboxylase [Streptomyces sp. NPDC002004]
MPGRQAPAPGGPVPTPGRPAPPPGLVWFNAAPEPQAHHALLGCCASHRWAERLIAHRPYPNLDALLAAADEAAYDLAPGDLTEALALEAPAAPPGVARSDAARTALDAAHAAYESRFGHVFVICLDDCTQGEALDRVLDGIRSRLNNDREDERVMAAEELRRLARGRITRLMTETAELNHSDSRPGSRPDSPYVPV